LWPVQTIFTLAELYIFLIFPEERYTR
jgi:hypothetical protein